MGDCLPRAEGGVSSTGRWTFLTGAFLFGIFLWTELGVGVGVGVRVATTVCGSGLVSKGQFANQDAQEEGSSGQWLWAPAGGACAIWGNSEVSGVLGCGDPLEKGTATHSSILAWRIPWTAEPDGLQSMGWQRVGHD